MVDAIQSAARRISVSRHYKLQQKRKNTTPPASPRRAQNRPSFLLEEQKGKSPTEITVDANPGNERMAFIV